MTKILTLLLSTVILITSIHPIHAYENCQVQQTTHTLQLSTETSGLNLTCVYAIYSNVFITQRNQTSAYVAVTHKGPYKQTAWTVLMSPWKPLFITSGNTNQRFTELNYDPETMPTNPIAETEHQYAWSYDPLNQVLFIKLLLTSTATATIFYALPKITQFISKKTSYTPLESINILLTVYGNYSAQATINWLAKLTITDSTNNIIKTIDRNIRLQNNQSKKLEYSMSPLSQGTYTATAQIIDPANGLLSTQQLIFRVAEAPPPPIPIWAIWVIGVLVIITVATVAVAYYYKRRKSSL